MGLGQNTFWLVVDLHEAAAVTPTTDKRAACRYTTAEAAGRALLTYKQSEANKANAGAGAYDLNRYIVIRVAA